MLRAVIRPHRRCLTQFATSTADARIAIRASTAQIIRLATCSCDEGESDHEATTYSGTWNSDHLRSADVSPADRREHRSKYRHWRSGQCCRTSCQQYGTNHRDRETECCERTGCGS